MTLGVPVFILPQRNDYEVSQRFSLSSEFIEEKAFIGKYENGLLPLQVAIALKDIIKVKKLVQH